MAKATDDTDRSELLLVGLMLDREPGRGDPVMCATHLHRFMKGKAPDHPVMLAIPAPYQSPQPAREIGQTMRGLAERMQSAGVDSEARLYARIAKLWLTYAMALENLRDTT